MEKYKGILETLKKQLQLNHELLIFSQEKLEFLRNNDTAGLMALCSEEEKVLRQIIDLEKERGNALSRLQEEGEDITSIHHLIEKSDPALARELSEVAQSLKKVLYELQTQNEINKTIMNFTLEQIEIAKNFILSDETPANYGRAGSDYTKENNKFFEGKA